MIGRSISLTIRLPTGINSDDFMAHAEVIWRNADGSEIDLTKAATAPPDYELIDNPTQNDADRMRQALRWALDAGVIRGIR